MRKLALTLLMATMAMSTVCTSVFAAETVTFNGGHIYQAQAGKPGTIQLDITNVDSQANVKMDTNELMSYLDNDGTVDKIIYTDEEGKGYSIRALVTDLNAKGGVPVYTASAMPSLTAKTPMTAFMSFWNGDDNTKVAFAPKFYLHSDFIKTGGSANIKVYDTKPADDCLYAPGTAENITKTGKYLFVVHDAGGIDQSPLSLLCVNVGANNATTSPTVVPAPAPPTAPTVAKPMGWVKADGVWRYYDDSRSVKIGWFNDNGTWYYLNSDGAMKTGWLKDNGTWYYLNDNGAMAINTAIDGYTLDANGALIN